ncbi:hypothetical protein OIU78_003110, partial [Salix suchowensis]
MSSDDEREERELDLTSSEVVTKYKSAAEIVNRALQLVISECKPKAKIVDICEKGDSFIREQTGNIDESCLEEGDIVKIDLGCHIDGFIAVVGHTHALQSGPVKGRAADVIAAANTAAEVALRLVRPGKK